MERSVIHGSAPHVISPYAMFTDHDCAYVVSYPDKDQKICVHRLDRIFGVPENLDDIAILLPSRWTANTLPSPLKFAVHHTQKLKYRLTIL